MTEQTDSTTGPTERSAGGEPDALGASASLPGDRRSRKARRAGRTGEPPEGGARPSQPASAVDGDDTGDGDGDDDGDGYGRRLLLAVAVVLALALVPAVTSAFASTPEGRVGVSYSDGPIGGVRFQRVVEPGSSTFYNGFFGELYLYPVGRQAYLADGEETDPIRGTTSDGMQVDVGVAVSYRLNVDQARAFHEQEGLVGRAYTDEGWERTTAAMLRPQLESALQEITRRHGAVELATDPDVVAEVEDHLQSLVGAQLERATGAPFLCGPAPDADEGCADPIVQVTGIFLSPEVRLALGLGDGAASSDPDDGG